VGEFLASQGVGSVLPNYRLSPDVKHPEHVRDVARAFAWAHAHAAEYGGDPDQLFLLGHSAGAHLVSLLATDERHLEALGLRPAHVRGVIAVSGVYRIPAGKLEVSLGGDADNALRVGQVVPLRSPSKRGRALVPGLPISLNLFGPPFGDDPQAREDASPLKHVCPGLPPFLLLHADNDLPLLAGMAQEFHQALVEQGCPAWLHCVGGRNHHSVFFRAVAADDPVAGLMLGFIREHAGRRAGPCPCAGRTPARPAPARP
jgi:acetyl esterase/lipase